MTCTPAQKKADLATRAQAHPFVCQRIARVLVVARIRGTAIAIAIFHGGRTGSRGASLAAPAEPRVLIGDRLDISRGRMAGQGIWGGASFPVAAPELAAATKGVVVGWGGAKALLTLVVAGHQDFEEDGDQEQETR